MNYKYSIKKALLFLLISAMLIIIGIYRAKAKSGVGVSTYEKQPIILNGTLFIILGIGFLIASIINFIMFRKPKKKTKWKKRNQWPRR